MSDQMNREMSLLWDLEHSTTAQGYSDQHTAMAPAGRMSDRARFQAQLGACPCSADHHQGLSYYVEVTLPDPGAQAFLAAGPYRELAQAEARLLTVRHYMRDHAPLAYWCGYGIVAMPGTYREPGKLNTDLAKEA